MDCSLPVSYVCGDSPGEDIGFNCHALLQGIFLTEGSNPGLPCCRWILNRLSHGFLIKVWFIYYVVLVPGVQQSDSAIHMCVSIFFRLFSLIGYYKGLSIVTCVVTIGPCLLSALCIVLCIYYSQTPHLSFPFSPLVIILFSMSGGLFLFHK